MKILSPMGRAYLQVFNLFSCLPIVNGKFRVKDIRSCISLAAKYPRGFMSLAAVSVAGFNGTLSDPTPGAKPSAPPE